MSTLSSTSGPLTMTRVVLYPAGHERGLVPMTVVSGPFPAESHMEPERLAAADYWDSFRAPLTRTDASVTDLFHAVLCHHPMWLKRVLIARNAVARRLGLRRRSPLTCLSRRCEATTGWVMSSACGRHTICRRPNSLRARQRASGFQGIGPARRADRGRVDRLQRPQRLRPALPAGDRAFPPRRPSVADGPCGPLRQALEPRQDRTTKSPARFPGGALVAWRHSIRARQTDANSSLRPG